ncbi:hypothetical protein LP419_10965 [Massilia sp. H-1]|nr:hypothetical protein LP419_10965 [Massilia sp. H-1]
MATSTPPSSNTRAWPTISRAEQAGGIDNVAAALQAWRKEDKDLLFVAAHDLVGASPAMSSLWADEPSIEALTMA